MKVIVDVNRCLGSGHCLAAVPEVFDQADDGTAIVLDTNPPDELRDALEHAVRTCPAMAISIEAETGGPVGQVQG